MNEHDIHIYSQLKAQVRHRVGWFGCVGTKKVGLMRSGNRLVLGLRPRDQDLIFGVSLRRERERKVFSLGYGKTGTSTLWKCFDALGYVHLKFTEHNLMLYDKGDIDGLIKLAHQFDTCDDFPWPFIYSRLAETFPEARFILTQRKSSDIWFDSLCRHVDSVGPSEGWRIPYGHADPRPYRAEMIEIYEKHNADVEEYFRGSDRLKVICWGNGDGYPELCGFLGVPIPRTPLPHIIPGMSRKKER